MRARVWGRAEEAVAPARSEKPAAGNSPALGCRHQLSGSHPTSWAPFLPAVRRRKAASIFCWRGKANEGSPLFLSPGLVLS